jgi:hypothetical protein
MSPRRRSAALLGIVGLALAASGGACNSSTPAPGGHDGGAGASGAAGASGTNGGAGTTGASGASGTNGGAGATGASDASGGAGTAGASGAGGGGSAAGGQPLGSACANTGNCSQADGAAVCCVQISTCVLTAQCPMGTNFLACNGASDCSKFGGGKVCCKGSGAMGNYCTKPSGCPGPTLP